MRGQLIGALAVLSVAVAPVAHAQPPCSIHTVTGTYAIQVTGWSASGSVAVIPGYGPVYDLVGGSAVFVGQVTIAADGTTAGTYWGVYVAAPVPVSPFTGTIQVNSDCTVDSGGDTGVVVDNGKEIRFITWGDQGTNTQTWYRMTPANGRGPSCGPRTFSGTYVERCEGFSLYSQGEGQLPGIATSNVLMIYTARNGSLTGTYRGKVYGWPSDERTESGLTGTYTVNPDCTIDIGYSLDLLPVLEIKARGVLFDQGKQGLGLPMGAYLSGEWFAPAGPFTCKSTRLGK